MDLPLCELEVQIEGSPVQPRIEQVYSELEQRGLRFRPYFWVSEDWFTPQDVPGCAVPFYLLHPRLLRLERRHMLEVEGAGRAECMKLLRHEVGHAIDHAFRLYRRRERQKLFGRSSKRYPESYGPRPRSRHFVQHLDYWYAQAHPDEDFAETFAVWSRTTSRSRTGPPLSTNSAAPIRSRRNLSRAGRSMWACSGTSAWTCSRLGNCSSITSLKMCR